MPAQLFERSTTSTNEATSMINDGAIRVDPASDPIQSLPIPASQAVVNHESSTISITSTSKNGCFWEQQLFEAIYQLAGGRNRNLC